MRFAVDSFANQHKTFIILFSTAPHFDTEREKKVVFQIKHIHTYNIENLFIEIHKYMYIYVCVCVLWYLWIFFFFYISTTIYELLFLFLFFSLLYSMMKRSFCECCFYWIINFWIANIYGEMCFLLVKIINMYICGNKEYRGELLWAFKAPCLRYYLLSTKHLRWWNNKFVEDSFCLLFFWHWRCWTLNWIDE